MRDDGRRAAGRVGFALMRVLSLVVLAGLGTVALMRWAPGYFADSREMDAPYADAGRRAVEARRAEDGSVAASMGHALRGLARGDFGRSRQFDVPVGELLRERAGVTAKLLAESVGLGWGISFALALALSGRRGSRGEVAIAVPSAVLLAVPAGALATLCLVGDFGGPLLVLASLVAVRDFKLAYRLMRRTWRAQHYVYARAQGLGWLRIVRVHLVPSLRQELLALAMTSVVVALSLVVPVEVIFDVPGLGQLAWSAALNRDLPVLLAVTLLVAACVGGAAAVAGRTTEAGQLAEVSA